MLVWVGAPFSEIRERLGMLLLDQASDVDVGEWHAKDVRGVPSLVSRELLNVSFEVKVPRRIPEWQVAVAPNLPWAEDHFQERVGCMPLNPGEEYKNWPWASGYFDEFQQSTGQFSHTYMERFWPKWAGPVEVQNEGIRFPYGDLGDVVDQLRKNPLTRQAYLPVFFPEDTGAIFGERVPCTLGYHFYIRNNQLNCTYYLRSCDFVRYFQDDVYMAGRLLQWVREDLMSPWDEGDHAVDTGKLLVHITSLHVMKGDMDDLRLQFG